MSLRDTAGRLLVQLLVKWRQDTWREVSLIIYLLVSFATVGATIFYFAEPKWSVADSAYWALVTMTTLGYGDISPGTPWGRVAAVILMFGGVSVLGLISATIASALVERRLKEGKGLSQVTAKEHLVIAGWASQGEVVLAHLDAAQENATLQEGMLASLIPVGASHMNEVVLINELGEQAIDALAAKFKALTIRYVHGDPTQDFVLKRANAHRASAALVLAAQRGEDTSDEAVDNRTLKVVMGLRSFSTDLRIFAELRSVTNEQHLRRAGADDIISPFEMGANVLANAPLSPGLPGLLKELLAFDGNGFQTLRIDSRYVGQPVAKLFDHLRSQRAILVGLVSESKSLGLEDLMQDSGGGFIDAFISAQFAQAEDDQDRQRFQVRVNPPDVELVLEGERALVIIHQDTGGQG